MLERDVWSAFLVITVLDTSTRTELPNTPPILSACQFEIGVVTLVRGTLGKHTVLISQDRSEPKMLPRVFQNLAIAKELEDIVVLF